MYCCVNSLQNNYRKVIWKINQVGGSSSKYFHSCESLCATAAAVEAETRLLEGFLCLAAPWSWESGMKTRGGLFIPKPLSASRQRGAHVSVSFLRRYWHSLFARKERLRGEGARQRGARHGHLQRLLTTCETSPWQVENGLASGSSHRATRVPSRVHHQAPPPPHARLFFFFP